MDHQVVTSIFNKATWKFAKTMPENPHEYILHQHYSWNVWHRLVIYIRDNGVYEEWKPKIWLRYCYIGGYKYWTMDYPVNKTKVINRAKVTP